jgi:phytoene dehydrogenase-like protein
VQLGPLLTKGAATPPLPLNRFMGLLEESPMGRELAASFFNSAYDILCYYFESVEVKMHFMKWVAEAMENPETNGTGILIYNLLALVHCGGAFAPVGGAQRVTDALVRCIQHYGGTLRLEAEAVRVVVFSGRATGVRLKDGEEIRARQAVIGCIHPWNLGKFVPEVDRELATQARRVKLSNHGAVNQQISLSTEPIFKANSPEIFRECMVVEYMPRDGMAAMREALDGFRYGKIPYGHISPLTIINSFIDKTRVPKAGQCALYLYNFAPLQLAEGGLEAWDARKQEYADLVWQTFKRFTTNIDDSMILGRHIETPLDHHRHSASMMHGDIFGIGTTAGQMLGRRPIPALANYRVPGISGLYLAGPFMHPGGTVTLGGRATAMVLYQDLGIDLGKGFEGI